MNKDKVIKDLKERNNILSNQYMQEQARNYNLNHQIEQLKEEINKISKKELKIMQMLRSIELCPLTKERIDRIEEVMFEILKEDNKEKVDE